MREVMFVAMVTGCTKIKILTLGAIVPHTHKTLLVAGITEDIYMLNTWGRGERLNRFMKEYYQFSNQVRYELLS